MESSAALFAQGSPFAVRSPPRSHYHPSPARPRHQRTVLGPARLLPGVPAAATLHPLAPAVSSPLDLKFLQDPSCQGTALDSDSTNLFPESWPSTESSSSNTLQGAPALGQPPSPPTSVQDGESVIAKYIERFRHGRPSSRSQRQAPALPSTREFWWLEPVPPSDSSTPKGGDSPGGAQLEEASPRWALGSPPLCPMGSPADTSLPDPPDADTQSLQERAARLLLRSESSVSSTVPVSSEGLHSTPQSSIPDSDQALPGPPQLSLLEPSPGLLPPTRPVHIPQCTSSIVPEEDILFQWRLRRKMEQASQAVGSLSVADWSTPLAWGPRMGDRACTVHPGLGLVPGMTSGRCGDDAVFISRAAQPEVRSSPEWALIPTTLHQGMGHPQGHPPRAGHPLEVPFQRTESVVGTNCKAVHVLGQLASATAAPSTLRPEGGVGGGGDAAVMWSSREAHRGARPAERPGSREAHRGAGPAERPGSREAHQEAWALGAAQHLPKETTRSQSMRGRGDGGAPEPEATHRRRRKSRKGELSIHSTLGQVISERLFSPPASPLPCREQQSGQGVEPGSPPEQATEPELLDLSAQHSQLLRLAARLLEDAEESDGTEFAEDPLLRVLRDQREALRSHLRAVDIAVAQLLSQGAAEPMSEPPGHPC